MPAQLLKSARVLELLFPSRIRAHCEGCQLCAGGDAQFRARRRNVSAQIVGCCV